MSEAGTESAPTDETPAEQPAADATDWKAEARKWEARAKDNAKARSDIEKQQRAAMTEADRAIAEAEERGRTAATSTYGQRLARTQFDALAGRRNPDFDSAQALEFVDMGRFLGDDGEPDAKAIASAVERLIPAPSKSAPSFDGGSRTTAATGGDMNSLIRRAAGLG